MQQLPRFSSTPTAAQQFAGQVYAGGNPTNGANSGTQIHPDGYFRACRKNNPDFPVFEGYDGAGNNRKVVILAGGSATFAGQTSVGSASGSTASYVRLYPSGGVVAYGKGLSAIDYSYIGRSDVGGANKTVFAFRGDGQLNIGGNIDSTASATPNITLAASGSATFAGTLNAGKVGSDTQTIITNDGIIYNGNTGGNFRNVINGTNGSASFAGKITAASTEDSDGGNVVVTKDYLGSAGSGGTGALGYWTRTGTNLSPVNASDSAIVAAFWQVRIHSIPGCRCFAPWQMDC